MAQPPFCIYKFSFENWVDFVFCPIKTRISVQALIMLQNNKYSKNNNIDISLVQMQNNPM